jgi:hypothetical protein
MILENDAIFCDPRRDLILPVTELTHDDFSSGRPKLDENHFYLIGDYIYRYVPDATMKNLEPGTIGKFGGVYYLNPHTETDIESYNKQFITTRHQYEERINGEDSFEDMMHKYAKNYKANKNIIRSGNIKIVPIGEIYMPDIEPDDDPLERIVKMMIRHMKPVLNEYRGQFAKKHGLDNIKSALNGATKNMSILKFLAWCDTFELDWDIIIDNIDSNVPHPMETQIVLCNREEYPWEDIPYEDIEYFTVPLTEDEDPLKRGIKLALWQKKIDLKEYRKKSPSQHLLNNMKSALKSKQKMTLPYFLNWCEIIDLSYSFRLLNQTDGIWYKITGYDITTNDKELE